MTGAMASPKRSTLMLVVLLPAGLVAAREGADVLNGQAGPDRGIMGNGDGDTCIKPSANPDPWIGTTRYCHTHD